MKTGPDGDAGQKHRIGNTGARKQEIGSGVNGYPQGWVKGGGTRFLPRFVRLDGYQCMRLEIKDLPETAFWRIYCRAVEKGRDVNAEIVATLSAGHADAPVDVNARLSAARRLRKRVRPATGQQ